MLVVAAVWATPIGHCAGWEAGAPKAVVSVSKSRVIFGTVVVADHLYCAIGKGAHSRSTGGSSEWSAVPAVIGGW